MSSTLESTFQDKEGNLKEMNLITNYYLPLKIRIALDSSPPRPTCPSNFIIKQIKLEVLIIPPPLSCL